MNPGNTRMYAPVMRGPLLFHQNNATLNSNYYPIQQSLSSYPPGSSVQHFLPFEQASFPPTTSSPSYFQSYPYPPPAFGSIPPVPLGYTPVIAPDPGYARQVSANGLTLILIAILILVALDLTLVRPQKGY